MAFLKGENRILYIKKTGVWVPIGCLTSNSFSESAEMMDVSTRDITDGWMSSRPVRQTYNISFAGLVEITPRAGTIGYAELLSFKRGRTLLEWKIESSENAGDYEEGTGFISSISDSAEAGDAFVEFEGEITGTGLPLASNLPPVIDNKWIEIDDAWVYKGTNTNKIAIEIGDMIRRYPSTTRYVHARVDALPYTNDANLSIFEEIILI